MKDQRNLQSMFDNEQSMNQQNFRQTFGNKTPKIPNRNQNNPHSETRIRLLASFQQSYQDNQKDSFSHHLYTQNMRQSQIAHQQQKSVDDYRLITSKKSNLKNRRQLTQESINQMMNKERSDIVRGMQNNSNTSISDLQKKVQSLRTYIEDELFAIKIEEQTYDFLTNRIDRGIKQHKSQLKKKKIHKVQDYSKLYENAVQFMDKSEQFKTSIKQLQQMMKTNN